MSGIKRYQNPEVYERLAAEYVLGTLKGRARQRFERLLNERPYIRYAVDIWEQRLNPAVELLPETQPPAHVWQKIKRQISASEPTVDNHRSSWRVKLTSFFQKPAFWQATTAMLAVVLVFTTLLPQTQNGEAMPQLAYISVLAGEGDKPMAVTMGDKRHRMVSVRLMEKPKMGDERVLELWAIKDATSPPVRVGVIPADRKESHIKLSKEDWKKMKGAKQFAITFEPRDRADDEIPSGPVMYKGKCIDFI